MTDFARSFPIGDLRKWDSDHKGNLVRCLFERWAYPGIEATDAAKLRLGIRNGYVNFYVKGQSVAKLSCGRKGPKLEVHEAYYCGRKWGASRDKVASRPYVTLNANELEKPTTAACLNGWIETAESYASAEKCFIDDLISTNPGIIDLEMGLPAPPRDNPGVMRVAPRMDIVIVQFGQGLTSVAFWEAKCVNNKELRSKHDHLLLEGSFSGPKVFGQLQKYINWISQDKREEQVEEAYKKTACLLLKFHELFSREKESRPECVTIWEKLAAAKDLKVVKQAGVVIGNYCPNGCKDSKETEKKIRNAASSFNKYGHRLKLQEKGFSIHEVGPETELAVLPNLPM